MQINDGTKVEELGYLLRTNGFSLGIEYGSGGYEVTITNLHTGSEFTAYSGDLLEAVKKAFAKAMASKAYLRDEKTDPGIPLGKNSVSIKELEKLLCDGKSRKVKY